MQLHNNTHQDRVSIVKGLITLCVVSLALCIFPCIFFFPCVLYFSSRFVFFLKFCIFPHVLYFSSRFVFFLMFCIFPSVFHHVFDTNMISKTRRKTRGKRQPVAFLPLVFAHKPYQNTTPTHSVIKLWA